MSYQVKAPVVKVSIGSLTGNRVARILRAGAVVPEGVAPESLELLAARGLIEEVDVPEADSVEAEVPATVPATETAPQAPEAPVVVASVPPKAGQGSSAEAWRAYAAAVGVEVAGDASRDDVIAAVDAAGKPTE